MNSNWTPSSRLPDVGLAGEQSLVWHAERVTKTQLIVVGGGVELLVRELGERHPGETSLLVPHGGPSWDHTYLLPGLQPLAHTRHIVLFDMRGCGRSSRDLDPSSYQPEYVVEDTHHLINGLGLGAVDLLGFSTGGQVAQLFAEAHPGAPRGGSRPVPDADPIGRTLQLGSGEARCHR